MPSISSTWVRLQETKENYTGSITWRSFSTHPYRAMSLLRSLASISSCINSIHVLFSHPFNFLTFPTLISSTRLTGASVYLHCTWSNNYRRFSCILSFMGATLAKQEYPHISLYLFLFYYTFDDAWASVPHLSYVRDVFL